MNGFEDPLIANVFWRYSSVCFEKILFVSVVSILVRNTETNGKKCFLVSRNKPKNNRNRLSFGLFRFEPKKNLIVSRTTYFQDQIYLVPLQPNGKAAANQPVPLCRLYGAEQSCCISNIETAVVGISFCASWLLMILFLKSCQSKYVRKKICIYVYIGSMQQFSVTCRGSG